MVAFGDSGSSTGNLGRTGLSDEKTCWSIVFEVVVEIREAISDIFGFIKTVLVDEFN